MHNTNRLIIRRFVPEDWQALYAILSDPEVVRFEPYPPFTPAQAQEAAAVRAASPDFWAVCLRESGLLIGNIYLAAQPQQTWILGYVFGRAHQGKGYASEATRALLAHAFTHENAHRIQAMCNPENTASWRLLERLSFRREGHLLQNVYFTCHPDGAPIWQDTYLYGLLRADWQGAQP